MKKLIIASLAMTLALTFAAGCQRQDVGTTVGAVGGGVIGSELSGGSTAGTIAGAVGGGYIGRELSD